MAKVEQLNSNSHRKIKIKTNRDVSDLQDQSILPLVLAEFPQAAIEFPICFIKNAQNEDIQVVALMGIESKENLFVVDGDKWNGAYMPARYTHRPFGLVQNPDDKSNFGIAINVESNLVNEEEGIALFDEEGKETEFLVKQKEAMAAYLQQEQMTKAFAKELMDKGFLVQKQINVKVQDQQYDIDGVYIVDEKKIDELSDEEFLNLRKRGLLNPIFTHLISMRQMNNLIKRKSEKVGSPA
ncbi:SapC family protein [Paraneptunicella aestuarii]|uniref:SapC family protein n=1 Tax=Paraneptunicella aestuarii TaxID=2831148 RepID=UPI001E3F8F89|nr:SapC family protein [Paraneptunicella aestuarii]UAA37310.1 SapC family protein [Paraneptunicella aestuarii]